MAPSQSNHTVSRSVLRSHVSREQLATMAASILPSSMPRSSPSRSDQTGRSQSRSLSNNAASSNLTAQDVETRTATMPSSTQAHSDSASKSIPASLSSTTSVSPTPGTNSLASTATAATPLSSLSDPSGYRSPSMRQPKPPVSPAAARRSPATASSSSSGISREESRLRVAQLRKDLGRANALVPQRHTAGLLRKAASTDLLFLIDSTLSMDPYIDAVRKQVKDIIADIKEAFLNQSVVRVAVVAYRDHDSPTHIESLDFTTSVDDVHRFLERLQALDGADFPEDVLGGIQQAVGMSWAQQTRCIIHICDAPGHSSDLHDLLPSTDHYFKPGSEPHGLTYEPLMKKMIKLRINYVLLNIGPFTDKMAMVFGNVYAAAGASSRLLPTNRYLHQMAPFKADEDTKDMEITCEELRLGENYDSLRQLVVRTVTYSMTSSANHLSVALGSRPMTASTLIAVHEDDEGGCVNIRLDKSPPRWDALEWFSETWELEGFCPDVVVYNNSTLGNMMASDDQTKVGVIQLTVHGRPTPFAHGGVRTASYARTAASTERFVIKSYLQQNKKGLEHLTEDMHIQALCKAFALEFNGLVKADTPLDFVVTSCLQTREEGSSSSFILSLEPFLDGEYVKYNNNTVFAREDSPEDHFNRLAQAFSHFTFERSWGHLMVVDLQGVGTRLTDPSIHTKDRERFKLTDTNMGPEGFKCFFAGHHCNAVCRELGLKSNRDQAIAGNYQFRDWWPAMDPTVCCSNKLCQRIMRLFDARQSEQFSGYRWCGSCWPQLLASMTREICASPGPTHEFDVSRFFSESQGRMPPQQCPLHAEKDKSASGAASAGFGLWNLMKSEALQRSTISGSSW